MRDGSRVRPIALQIGVGLLLAACLGPEMQRLEAPAEPPASPPSEPRAGGVVEPTAGEALTLTQVMEYAEAHAPSLRVARGQAKRGDAAVLGARVLVPYNPEVTVNAGGRTMAGVSRFEVGASLQQRVEIAGQRSTRVDAAAREREAREAEVEVARWQLHAQVHALFYKLLVREQRLVAAGKIALFTESLGHVIDRRVAAGEASPLEVVAATAELALARQAVIQARLEHRSLVLELSEVIGWPFPVPLEVSGALEEPAPAPEAGVLVRAALEGHPSRRWLDQEVRAAEARVEREDRRAWPDPTLGIAYGQEAEPGVTAHVWQGTLTMPLPVWERNQRGRAEVRAELGLARTNQQAFEARLGARIAAAAAGVDAAAERVRAFGADILPAFEKNLDQLQRAFELGEIGVLQLAQIQQRVLLTQQAALSALEDYYDAVATLEALSGVDLLPGGDR